MRLAHSREVPHPRPIQHRRHVPDPILGNRGIQNLPVDETSPSCKFQQPGIVLQVLKDLFHHDSLATSTVHRLKTYGERAGREPASSLPLSQTRNALTDTARAPPGGCRSAPRPGSAPPPCPTC